jgi:hypothetical protein
MMNLQMLVWGAKHVKHWGNYQGFVDRQPEQDWMHMAVEHARQVRPVLFLLSYFFLFGYRWYCGNSSETGSQADGPAGRQGSSFEASEDANWRGSSPRLSNL